MLILTRRTNELIYLYPDDLPPDMTVAELFAGGQIAIEVLSIRGNQVKLGIDAPKRLKVLRDDAKELD
jgi:sRNA-binding carbon storage regulator CsrA